MSTSSPLGARNGSTFANWLWCTHVRSIFHITYIIRKIYEFTHTTGSWRNYPMPCWGYFLYQYIYIFSECSLIIFFCLCRLVRRDERIDCKIQSTKGRIVHHAWTAFSSVSQIVIKWHPRNRSKGKKQKKKKRKKEKKKKKLKKTKTSDDSWLKRMANLKQAEYVM